MNFIENIREALRSIKGNMLRTVLTALIIAIGITSLVGILTAIDGIQSSVDNSFSGLGANSFDIRNRDVLELEKKEKKNVIIHPSTIVRQKCIKHCLESRLLLG
jgi:putative ABC transport system permease protein